MKNHIGTLKINLIGLNPTSDKLLGAALCIIGDTMKRNKGIIAILVGVGLLFISIFFSSGSHPKLNLLGNISRMEIVLDKGNYVFDKGNYVSGIDLLSTGHYEGRVAIPLKYPLSLSVVLILLGTGIALISKDKETSA